MTYDPFNQNKMLICETSPRPMEPIARVEANFVEGLLRSLTVGEKKSRADGEQSPRFSYLSCYDFTASPIAWREIIAVLAPFLGMQVVNGDQAGRKTSRTGRGAATVPDDVAPLLTAIGLAQTSGKPFHKTGRNGLYAKRSELPEGFNQIGRDRLEGLAGELLKKGRIHQDESGALTVPESRS